MDFESPGAQRFLVEDDNRVIKTSPHESHTGNPGICPRSVCSIVFWLVDVMTNSHVFSKLAFRGLIGSDEVIAASTLTWSNSAMASGVLDDSESNLRELKTTLSQMTECDWRTLGGQTCQSAQYHKGWPSVERPVRVLSATIPNTMWSVTATKRLLDTGTDDVRADHESQRKKNAETHEQEEPSSSSGIKRSTADVEAMRRADAEAERSLKRARMLEERRAAERASATPMDELEESATNDDGEKPAGAILVAVEALLTETRETIEALKVSALQQAHAASHSADVMGESFFQAHKDMTVTTKEQARKKHLDFLESRKVYEEVSADELLAGTHVMSGRWVDTMKKPTVWRSKYTARGHEEPHSDDVCFAATAKIQGNRTLLARCLDRRDQGHEAFVTDYTRAFLNAEVRDGEQLYAQPPEEWVPKLMLDG